jgi:hypothetical protein
MSISAKPASGPARLTAPEIWRAVARASFAVLSHAAPDGTPRSSGVVYVVSEERMYVVVGRDSWKARHIAANGTVSVTVAVRRGGLLSLLFPIPPATVSFPAVAVVHPGAELDRLPRLARLVPPVRHAECALLEIRPTGHYLTYGIGVSLSRMRDPAVARGRVAVAD